MLAGNPPSIGRSTRSSGNADQFREAGEKGPVFGWLGYFGFIGLFQNAASISACDPNLSKKKSPPRESSQARVAAHH